MSFDRKQDDVGLYLAASVERRRTRSAYEATEPSRLNVARTLGKLLLIFRRPSFNSGKHGFQDGFRAASGHRCANARGSFQ
jgi:hypothetical protein